MFKPTKPQHITNKAYVDNNSGGGGAEPFYFIADPLYSDKTAGEILNALKSGKTVFYRNESEGDESSIEEITPISGARIEYYTYNDEEEFYRLAISFPTDYGIFYAKVDDNTKTKTREEMLPELLNMHVRIYD